MISQNKMSYYSYDRLCFYNERRRKVWESNRQRFTVAVESNSNEDVQERFDIHLG